MYDYDEELRSAAALARCSKGGAAQLVRTLPRVVFPSAGCEAPVPPSALRYLETGMSFVMCKVALWPRAETLWWRRDYLRAALATETVRVRRPAAVPLDRRCETAAEAMARIEAGGAAGSALVAIPPEVTLLRG